MKNTFKITAVVAFTLMVTSSFGQSLNMSGGVTFSKLRMGDIENGSSVENYNGGTYTSTYGIHGITGFNTSLGYEFRLGNRLSLETGFKYMTRGYQMKSSYRYENSSEFYQESYNSKYKLNYFDLPITLNTAITTGDVRVYARTGIYVGFMTKVKYNSRYDFSNSEGDNAFEEHSYDEMDLDMDDRLTGGVTLGAGVEYKGFFFETNYNVGALMLTDIDYEAWTHDFSLSLGYKLKFKK